jgi:hypothetical protein
MDVGPACRNEMAASEGRPTVRNSLFDIRYSKVISAVYPKYQSFKLANKKTVQVKIQARTAFFK